MATNANEKFAGGDPDYLRTDQYGTTDKLQARANLHQRYSTATTPWFEWMVAQIPWRSGKVVEAGCGTGALWVEGRPPSDGPILLTDLSSGMVDASVAAAHKSGYVVQGAVAPAEDLPLHDRVCAHVISNHMLYHVPKPREAVAEFARVLADDGVLTVTTNGARHLRQLKEIEQAVFGTDLIHPTVKAFGLDNGHEMLDAAFADVELIRFPDELRVTVAGDALAFARSMPPAEDATREQLAALEAEMDAAFTTGGGTLVVEKESGLFVCRGPRRS